MEILNNFSSIYCFITFILGAIFMLATLCVVAMCKTQEPKNEVHFYVARDKNDELFLYIGNHLEMKIISKVLCVCIVTVLKIVISTRMILTISNGKMSLLRFS